ncbi:hypothetical protein RclHR1_00370020 [Rhizophagus clarus]|nr:hypothetical protein RclHR1_00370020 [Rhizophagus clarus]
MSSKYTPSQISEHWRNRLYPNLSHNPRWKRKKVSIIEHIEWIYKCRKSRINVLNMLEICFDNYYCYGVDRNSEKNNTLKLSQNHQKSRWKCMVRDLDDQPNKWDFTRRKDSSQKNDLEQKHTSRNAEKRKYKQNNFTLFLPSADNSHPYTPSIQNDSSSKVSVESLINESIPDFSQIIKEYIEECNRH